MARANSAWGIDVGVTSLKAVKLRRDGTEAAVEAFDVVEHDHFLTEPDVDRDEIIRHTLAKFLERNALKGEAVFVGVPGSSTFARFVKLPPVEAKKIPEIVRFEAIQQIPFPLEQVNWDYQTFTTPDSPEVEVGIFAMKKELVTQVMANFQSNGMTVHGVQMSPLAVYNAVNYDEMTGGKGTIVLDIGAEHTDLIFVDSGRVWLRTINIGGNNFTDSLSKSFKVPFAKAEQLKRTAATSKYAKQIFQAMRPVFADLVAEIQRSKGFYDSSHRDSKLERIIGMGNPFKLPNLQKYIQQELKMEVVRLEGFQKIQVDSKLAAGLNEHILSMGGAAGLALQGLDMAAIDTNLLPMDIARQMLWRQKRPVFAAAAALIAIGVGIGGYSIFRQGQVFADTQRSAEAQDHDNVVKQYEGYNRNYTSVPDDVYKKNKDDVEAMVNTGGDRKIWPEILVDLNSALPQKVGAGLASNRRLVLKSITSVYTTNVMGASAGTAATDTPAAASSFNPGGFGPGGFGPGPGGPQPGGFIPSAPVAAPAITVATTPGGAGAERGFLVVIRGFTPYHGPTANAGGSLVKEYVSKLMDTAPKDNSPKAYYFSNDPTAPYTGKIVGLAGAGTASQALWGEGSKGPYWDAFGPELLGGRDMPGGGGGGGGRFGPIGGPGAYGGTNEGLTALSSKPVDLDTKTVLDNYFVFQIQLRVVLRGPAQ